MIRLIFVVALGGAAGSVLRFLIQRALNPTMLNTFPLGTWLVNLLGSLLIGILWGISEKFDTLSEESKLLLITGICGGFTTLSALSQESILLLKDQKYSIFLVYFFTTLLGSLAATWGGYKLIVS